MSLTTACTLTDQVDFFLCIFVFSVVLQRDMCGTEYGRRALSIAVTVLWGAVVAQ